MLLLWSIGSTLYGNVATRSRLCGALGCHICSDSVFKEALMDKLEARIANLPKLSGPLNGTGITSFIGGTLRSNTKFSPRYSGSSNKKEDALRIGRRTDHLYQKVCSINNNLVVEALTHMWLVRCRRKTGRRHTKDSARVSCHAVAPAVWHQIGLDPGPC